MTDVIANAGNVKIVITGDGANFSQVVADVNRKLADLGVKGRAAGGHMVSGVQAASASIRILEGNVQNNVRAVERFLSTTLRLAPVLQAAFPVVGALAFGGIIAKIGEELYKFVHEAQQAPRLITQAFAASNSSMALANDQLALVNLRLENETAKLEKKPENHLSEALINSQVEAGKLVETLERVEKAQQDAFQGHEIGRIKALVTGQGTTDDVKYNMENFMSQIVGRQTGIQSALDRGDTAGSKNLQAQLDQLFVNAKAYADTEVTKRTGTVPGPYGIRQIPYASTFGDQTANLTALQGFKSSLELQQANQRLQAQHGTDATANDDAKARMSAAQQAIEAQKKTDEATKQQWQDQFSAMQALRGKDLADEVEFWSVRVGISKKGSETYIYAMLQMDKALADLRVDTAKQKKELGANLDELTRRAAAPDLGNSPEVIEDYKRQTKDTAELLRNNSDAAAALQQNSDRMQTVGLGTEQARGQITKLSYAQQMAALHTREFNDELERLQKTQSLFTKYSDDWYKYQGRINQAQGAYDAQHAQDVQASGGLGYSNPAVGITDAFDDIVAASHDLASSMRDLVGGIQDSFNNQIIRGLSGQRTDFSNTVANAARAVGGKALTFSEGELLSGLGFGGSKPPTGRRGDPFHVIIDAAAAAAGTASGSGATQGATSVVSGLVSNGFSGSSLLSAAIDAIPFLAGGGPIIGPAIVGEDGPELFTPGTSGTITPAGKFGRGGGGDTHTHLHIDARGATDPAAVRRMVMQGITAAAPHLVGASVAAHRDYQRRVPSSRR